MVYTSINDRQVKGDLCLHNERTRLCCLAKHEAHSECRLPLRLNQITIKLDALSLDSALLQRNLSTLPSQYSSRCAPACIVPSGPQPTSGKLVRAGLVSSSCFKVLQCQYFQAPCCHQQNRKQWPPVEHLYRRQARHTQHKSSKLFISVPKPNLPSAAQQVHQTKYRTAIFRPLGLLHTSSMCNL